MVLGALAEVVAAVSTATTVLVAPVVAITSIAVCRELLLLIPVFHVIDAIIRLVRWPLRLAWLLGFTSTIVDFISVLGGCVTPLVILSRRVSATAAIIREDAHVSAIPELLWGALAVGGKDPALGNLRVAPACW